MSAQKINFGTEKMSYTNINHKFVFVYHKHNKSFGIAPLSQPFQQYSKWVTRSWLRLVWEKVDMFNIRVKIRELPLKFPREHDGWLMIMPGNVCYLVDKLICLNSLQCHQQALFFQISLMQEAGC